MKDRAANVLKALGHPVRLKVVEMLAPAERCVCETFPELGINQPNASQHLAILKAAGIVDSYRDGPKVFYRFTSPKYADLVAGVPQDL